jgi:hypothetical protein
MVLLASPAPGATSVTVKGLSCIFGRVDALKDLLWQGRRAVEGAKVETRGAPASPAHHANLCQTGPVS